MCLFSECAALCCSICVLFFNLFPLGKIYLALEKQRLYLKADIIKSRIHHFLKYITLETWDLKKAKDSFFCGEIIRPLSINRTKFAEKFSLILFSLKISSSELFHEAVICFSYNLNACVFLRSPTATGPVHIIQTYGPILLVSLSGPREPFPRLLHGFDHDDHCTGQITQTLSLFCCDVPTFLFLSVATMITSYYKILE